MTLFRMCRLPTPIPQLFTKGEPLPERQLDVTHMFGTDWGPTTLTELQDGMTGYALEKRLAAKEKE